MKLLLDENLPVKLKTYFSDSFQVSTVAELEWNSKKNGELLELMTLNGFEALVTIDKNLKYQQNIKKFDVQIIILDSTDNKLTTLNPFIKKLENKLSEPNQENIIEITG